MPEIPRTKFNSPWTVAVIEAALNDVSSAKGSSESLTAALNAMRAEINSLSGGVHLKGAVDYYSDLPASPSEGDAYTVRYQGTSGTDPLGIEYAWATYQGTPQWIPIGVDPSVFAKQREMDVVANAGAKNLLHFNAIGSGGSVYGNTYTHNGITYTLNADGTVTATGTAYDGYNSYAYLILNGSFAPIDDYCDGKHIVSGCPANGSTSKYSLYIAQPEWGAVNEIGSGTILPDKGNYTGFLIACFVSKGYAIPAGEPLVFKPMIRPAEITDPTFQPFARTNRELTVLTDEDRASLVEIVDGGAKNVLYYTKVGTSAQSGSQFLSNGVRFTMQSDGGILVNRESSNANIAFCNLRLDSSSQGIDDYCNGQYVISGSYGGCTVCATNNTYYVADSDGSGVVLQDRGVQTGIFVQLRVAASASPNNVTVKPMICSKSAWDISHAYVPYAKTNRDLTVLTDEDRDALVEIVDGGAKNLLKFDYISGGTAQGGGTSWTSNGVEFSLADGEITVNRTSASSSDATCQLYLGNSKIYIDSVCDGEHILSGCPSGGSEDKFYLMAARDSYARKDIGNGILITDNGSANNVYLQITVKASYSPSNLQFHPMICTAAAWKISQSFQPYRPSWQEMYDRIVALETGGNRALTMQMQQTESTEPEEQEER